MHDLNAGEQLMISETLEGWVDSKAEEWRDHYESNYEQDHNEYYRIWRGIWTEGDKTRESERSRIVSPALMQAVENNVAEIEEATFGRGYFFDIKDNYGDAERLDVMVLRHKLNEEFYKNKIRASMGEVLINAAVYGTGIAEVVLEEEKEMVPATEPVMEGAMQAVGVQVRDKTSVKLRPIQPHNFLIDPVATSVNEACGVIIDEFVPVHQVELLQEQGVYNDVYVGTAADDLNIEADPELWSQPENKVRLTKYYGLVPRDLLRDASDEEVMGDDEDSHYVEAIVVLGNGKLLKAEENPYMMGDRPVVAFSWDCVPGRFWGMGVCEKGYNSQKALDAEIRARIDALALTVHPMLAMDATRIPRGSRPEVKAGKLILTNGDPRETLQPFNFGNVDQITFAQAESLQRMVNQATGAVDTSVQQAGGPNSIGNSMSQAGIVKRQKRTLVNFQECFLVPFLEKAAYRYMQFEPEFFPAGDYQFTACSSLGIIAREYEVAQLVQLLQTTGPENPVYPAILESVIDNMNVSNREELIVKMRQASQPSPEQQQAQQASQQAQMAFQQSQTAALNGQAAESQARAQKITLEARGIPVELENDRIKALGSVKDDNEKQFERKMRIADLALNEQKLGLEVDKENIKRSQGAPNGSNPQQQDPMV